MFTIQCFTLLLFRERIQHLVHSYYKSQALLGTVHTSSYLILIPAFF